MPLVAIVRGVLYLWSRAFSALERFLNAVPRGFSLGFPDTQLPSSPTPFAMVRNVSSRFVGHVAAVVSNCSPISKGPKRPDGTSPLLQALELDYSYPV
jgi:hypothetical protein